MPATAQEMRPRSGSAKAPQRVYLVQNAANETEALEAAFDEAPSNIWNCFVDDMTYEEVEDLDGVYNVTVSYAPTSSTPENGDVSYTLDYSAKALQINYSLETIYATTDAPDFQQAINVVSDNGTLKIEGHSREIPPDTIKLGYTLPATTATASYLDDLEQFCGCVNSASVTIYGITYPAGELLLSRASGSLANADQFQVQIGFSRIPNATDVVVGDLTVPSVDGHDLLWIYYEESRDDDGRPTKVARAAYVERIWPRANLNAIFV